jgi:hypothetical protein
MEMHGRGRVDQGIGIYGVGLWQDANECENIVLGL